jgi:hypothetical protein
MVNKEFNRMRKLAGLLNEEQLDFNSELDSFFKSNPVNEKNKYYVEDLAKKHIENIANRPLTPQEKSKITKISNIYRNKYYDERFETNYKEEEDSRKARYQNNFLPLTTDNGRGTPDKKYYKYAISYNEYDKDGDLIGTFHQDPKSGYTNYKLKDEWINTPVPKDILDKYWRK